MNTPWRTLFGRLLVALVLCGTLVACGSNAEPTAEAEIQTIAEATATSVPDEPTATPEPVATATEQPAAAPAVAVLNVGVNASFKPFAYQDEQGNLVGFDIDLMDALATAGGFEFGFTNMAFEELLGAVESGTIDVGISAITITPERQRHFALTEPYFGQNQGSVSYFSGGQGLAVRVDNMTITATTAFTAETKVGVKQGTTGANFVETETDATVVNFPEAEPALVALSQGEVSAVVIDVPVIVNYIKTNPGSGIKLAGRPITEEQYGIAVSKGKPEVLALLNESLRKIRDDGTYDAIYQKWFGGP